MGWYQFNFVLYSHIRHLHVICLFFHLYTDIYHHNISQYSKWQFFLANYTYYAISLCFFYKPSLGKISLIQMIFICPFTSKIPFNNDLRCRPQMGPMLPHEPCYQGIDVRTWQKKYIFNGRDPWGLSLMYIHVSIASVKTIKQYICHIE